MPTIHSDGHYATGSISSKVAISAPYDLLCFSHLRWHFVTQRPQHLMTRSAKDRRTFFWEEPLFDSEGAGWLEISQEGERLWILRPHLAREGDTDAGQRSLLDRFMADWSVMKYVRWYYTPLALGFSNHIAGEATVYDCMDELTGFLGAPPELRQRECELFATADVVFTGGMSLYQAKSKQHMNVHAFPSSIDAHHFSAAIGMTEEPLDQAGIPHPRAGFYGVIDERFDISLMRDVAKLRPEMHFIFLGPVAKIDPASLPQGPNVHYLGGKSYLDLPKYVAAWDVAMLPFALNEATRFISPTKTPEYLAAGKPVVSTPIHDVVHGYGEEKLVAIASTAEEFAEALHRALQPPTEMWRRAVAEKLSGESWDKTWTNMCAQVDKIRVNSAKIRIRSEVPCRITGGSLPGGVSKRQEKIDYLVVGAGFAGSVLAERLASVMGRRVLIIDKRDHVGGNTYDYYDAAGILVHKYGPHIFHTNSDVVVQYLSRFTQWRPYEHRVLASVDGKLLPVPINLDTVNGLYGLSLDAAGMQRFLAGRTITPPVIRTSKDICISRVGPELYEKFFKNYTRKQWGLDPSELDSSVAGRIPVRFDQDARYFTDSFQAMPLLGYTRMFERMLDHPKIRIRTGVDYSEVAAAYPGVRTIFTGPVDEYFDYRFGPLPYRSLEFQHQTYGMEQYQPVAVVNYPNDHTYTRVTEFKHLTGQVAKQTSVVFEHPRAEGDPYYPIPRPENAAIYQKYKELADRTEGVEFVGRLATYRYYNMDQVVAQALALFKRIAGEEVPIMMPGDVGKSIMAEAR